MSDAELRWKEFFDTVSDLTDDQKKNIAMCLSHEANWNKNSRLEKHFQEFLLKVTFQLLYRIRHSFVAAPAPAFLYGDRAFSVELRNTKNATSRLFSRLVLEQTPENIDAFVEAMVVDYFKGSRRGSMYHLYIPIIVGSFLPPVEEQITPDTMFFGVSFRGIFIDD